MSKASHLKKYYNALSPNLCNVTTDMESEWLILKLFFSNAYEKHTNGKKKIIENTQFYTHTYTYIHTYIYISHSPTSNWIINNKQLNSTS